MPEEYKQLLDRMLLEKIPLAAIARVLQISETWVQEYVNQKYQDVPQDLVAPPAPTASNAQASLALECDELSAR